MLKYLSLLLIYPAISYLIRFSANGRNVCDAPRNLLAALYSAFISQAMLVFMWTAQFFPKKFTIHKKKNTTAEGRHMVCVHGLYHNPSAWTFFQQDFRRAGAGHITSVSYNSFLHTFPEIVLRTVQAVEAEYQSSGRPVTLVGHSLGGMACRAAATHPRLVGKIAGIVTLGTPHQGSRLAYLAIGRLGRALIHTDSGIPAEVNCRSIAESYPKLALYTAQDNMVLPNKLLLLPDENATREGWQYEELHGICHVGLLFRQKARNTATDWISKNIGW